MNLGKTKEIPENVNLIDIMLNQILGVRILIGRQNFSVLCYCMLFDFWRVFI